MGEFHYSRYPEKYWKEALLKIKAGGVQIVSTYVIWIHHEEKEGEWNFTGNKNLRKFTELVGHCGLTLFLRIGPWSHAEVRNGGFPDWLLEKPFEPRTNDPAYFTEVKKFYAKIYEQVRGLFIGDGGPIIGIQVENEFGHCGGLTGPEGEEHMRLLTAMAKQLGFTVPYYTATGWGGAVTGGLLPVMGGYVEAPWDQRITELEPSGNYIFTHERNDHNIGSDFREGEGITFDIRKFPYLTAELGGGLQVVYKRRPVACARDIGAMTIVKLGSGVNLLGYYMYHGGTNPHGTCTTLQESSESGSLNDLPVLSYDFRAPIREFGQISETYRELKKIALFAADFGDSLCRMPAYLPPDNPLKPADTKHLRYSWRFTKQSETGTKDTQGYLFVNNYVRRYSMAEHNSVIFEVPAQAGGNKSIKFKPLQIKDKDYFFLPFNMPVGNALIETAYVSPLCILNGSRPVYIFYKNLASRAVPQEDLICYRNRKAPTTASIVILDEEEALNAYKINLDRNYLIISTSSVSVSENSIILQGENINSFKSLPALQKTPAGYNSTKIENGFTQYMAKKEQPRTVLAVTSTKIMQDNEKTVFRLAIPEWRQEDTVDDYFIKIFYEGDYAKLFIDGKFADDNFYIGKNQPWVIGLKRFYDGTELYQKRDIRIEIYPLEKDKKIFLEDWPEFKTDRIAVLTKIQAEPEFKTTLRC
jgi:hypothetical protein